MSSRELALERAKLLGVKNVEIISEPYGNQSWNKDKVYFDCLLCGSRYSKWINNFLVQRLYCGTCGRAEARKHRPSNSLTYEEVCQRIREDGATPLFSEYKNNQEKLLIRCACGRIHELSVNHASLPGRKFHCRHCAQRRGEEHPQYKHGRSKEFYGGRTADDRAWYFRVFAKFNWTCVITGTNCSSKIEARSVLAAHHLFNYGDYPDLRLDLRNGVCILKELHREFHVLYGGEKTHSPNFRNFTKGRLAASFPILSLEPYLKLSPLVESLCTHSQKRLLRTSVLNMALFYWT